MDEQELLQNYRKTGSPESFRQLIERYVDFVYATARRQVRDAHLAEDVTQAVFLLLTRKAASVPTNRPLSAWLHRATVYISANARRAEQSRRKHEMNVMANSISHDPNDSISAELSPLLDEGIAKLQQTDRDAILLKYFEKKTHQEIAAQLGLSEEAAAKRVLRAVQRLRDFFRHRGVNVTDSAMSTFLVVKTIESAPTHLASSISAGQVGSAASLIKGVMLMTFVEKLKVAAIAGAVLTIGAVAIVTAVETTTKPAQTTQAPTILPTTAPAGSLTFKDGTVVEIVAIGDFAPNPKQWWKPDGSPTSKPVSASRANGRATGLGADQKQIQVVIKMTGENLGNKILNIALNNRGPGGGNGGMSWNNQRDATERIMQSIVIVPANQPTIDLRAGLAIPDTEWVLWQPGVDPATQPADADAPLVFDGIEDQDGQTIVTTHMGVTAGATGMFGQRLYAEVDGKRIPPNSMGSMNGSRTITFPVAKSKIGKIIFDSMKVQYLDFKDVANAPASK